MIYVKLSKSDSCLLLFVFSSNSRLCLAVRCDLDTLKNMVPTNAYLASARNYKTDRIYAQHQVNEFNYYGNVITIKCQNGFLYPDRTTEKLVICVLAENSQIDGVYNGYGGTSLPLPGACECELFGPFLWGRYLMSSMHYKNHSTSLFWYGFLQLKTCLSMKFHTRY